MSVPFPNETTFAKRAPRCARPLMMSIALPPDWHTTVTSPASFGWPGTNAIRAAGW